MTSQPPTVLLADDDEAALVVLGRYLRDEGYQVQVARDGREALQALAGSTPDAIVMDVHMPEMSGLDIAGRVRGVSRLQGVPVVLVTAHWNGELASLAQWEGVGIVLEKPVARAELIAALTPDGAGAGADPSSNAAPDDAPA